MVKESIKLNLKSYNTSGKASSLSQLGCHLAKLKKNPKNKHTRVAHKGAAILDFFPMIISYMQSDWVRNQPKKLLASHKACFIFHRNVPIYML